jgi:hypothetical protein
MAHVLETVAHIASIVASFGNYLSPSVAVSVAGLGLLNPRAGPSRAFVLGVSSKWGLLRPAFRASQRTAECQALKDAIDTPSFAQYIVVTGPKVRGDVGLSSRFARRSLLLYRPHRATPCSSL